MTEDHNSEDSAAGRPPGWSEVVPIFWAIAYLTYVVSSWWGFVVIIPAIFVDIATGIVLLLVALDRSVAYDELREIEALMERWANAE